MLAFFNPLILLIGTSPSFIFVVPFTLLIWFAAGWNQIARIEETSNLLEKLFGLGLYGLDIAYNMYRRYVLGIPRTPSDVGFGLIDMLIAFISVCIAFYGFRGARKHFILPTAYLSILIVGYELEYRIPEITFLQDFLASAITSILNLFTINASASSSVVTIHATQGIFSLVIDKDCTGLKSMLAYGSLAVLMILDVKTTYARKALCTIIGFVGTFFLNILRLLTIFLACYFFGIDAALAAHTYLGYSIFIIWVFLFWIISFKYLLTPVKDSSKRQDDSAHNFGFKDYENIASTQGRPML